MESFDRCSLVQSTCHRPHSHNLHDRPGRTAAQASDRNTSRRSCDEPSWRPSTSIASYSVVAALLRAFEGRRIFASRTLDNLVACGRQPCALPLRCKTP